MNLKELFTDSLTWSYLKTRYFILWYPRPRLKANIKHCELCLTHGADIANQWQSISYWFMTSAFTLEDYFKNLPPTYQGWLLRHNEILLVLLIIDIFCFIQTDLRIKTLFHSFSYILLKFFLRWEIYVWTYSTPTLMSAMKLETMGRALVHDVYPWFCDCFLVVHTADLRHVLVESRDLPKRNS